MKKAYKTLSKLLIITCVVFTVKSLTIDVFLLSNERLYDYGVSLAISAAILALINIKGKHK